MNKLSSAATVVLIAGLVGSAFWMAGTNAPKDTVQASALPKISKCRPHDDCARMARTKASVIEAGMNP